MQIWLPDLHLGHHSRSALRCALRLCLYYGTEVTRIGILGDWLDAHSFSSHPTTPGEKTAHYLDDEVYPCQMLLKELTTITGGAEIVYLEGNHEERVRRWLLSSKAARDLESVVTPEALLARDNLTWVPYRQVFHVMGGWVACHGFTECKDAARKHLDLVPGYSVIFGHTHRQQHVVRRDPISGRLLHGICPGTLSELQPQWAKGPTTWTHGITLLTEAGTPYNVPIHGGVATLPCGTQIDGNPEYEPASNVGHQPWVS